MIYTFCLDLYPISLQELIAISGKTLEINQLQKNANCKQFFHNKILTVNFGKYKYWLGVFCYYQKVYALVIFLYFLLNLGHIREWFCIMSLSNLYHLTSTNLFRWIQLLLFFKSLHLKISYLISLKLYTLHIISVIWLTDYKNKFIYFYGIFWWSFFLW